MFQCSQQLRSPQRVSSLTKSVDTSTDQLHQFGGVAEQQKKIETKQSFLSQKLKSSIISDSGYNSGIYEWRKVEASPIVRVIELAKRSQVDSLTGLSCTLNTIKPEPIYCRLSNFQQFSKEQILYILKNMLEGHQTIFKKMKATSVSLEKCVVTPSGEVKVWINQHLERNEISGEILSRQDEIAKRIFETVSFLASQNTQYSLRDFIEYVDASVRKSAKWSFASLKAMLKSYADCLRIKIPKGITFRRAAQEKRPVYSSITEGKLIQQLPRPRQNSFQFSHRNIQSSVNCSRNSCTESTNLLFGTMLESFIKNETCKTIIQAPHVQKSLAKYSRHTNSISLFKTQEDTILERSQSNHHEEFGEKDEHKKLPSINEILIKKIGFCSLPEVQYEEEQSSTPSARKESSRTTERRSLNLVISSQFTLKILETAEQKMNPGKQSSISTTNQTSISGNQLCFAKKVKESHLTINMDDHKEGSNKNQEFRTASRDRFKESKMLSMTEQSKKIIGSCTSWSNQPSAFDAEANPREIEQPVSQRAQKSEQKAELIQIVSKMQIESQVVSFKSIDEAKAKPLTPIKSTKEIIKRYLNNPLSLLNQLRSEEQLESYQNTQKNSSSCGDSPSSSVRQIRIPIQQKILTLLQKNRNLVVSTYLQTNSEKKIMDQGESPERERERKLKDIQETLSELVRANLKQQEILEGNSWTKNLQNLLGIEDELKQSISFGVEEANALIRELKLSKLDKCGRHIGNSQFPQRVSH